jgi:hypothetical protein
LLHYRIERRLSILSMTLLFAVSLSVLAGCDDPSSVGLELVGGSNGEPTSFVVEPSLFAGEDGRDVTGGRDRVLVGVVDDPIGGTISAAGYLDFSPVGVLSSAFQAGPVSSISLRLATDYVYGDTLQTGSLFVYDITEEFVELGFPADSTISIGGVVTQTAFAPTDTLVVVEIPLTWVNADSVRSSTAGTALHGFQLTATDLNSIVGFTDESVMRIVSGGDTTDFAVELSATTSERLTAPAPPEGRTIVQDTQGPTLGLDLTLDLDTLSDAVINRVVLQLFADSLLIQDQTPANFVRPNPKSFDLIAVRKDSSLVFLEVATISDEGILRFNSDLLRTTYQGRLLDNSLVDHLRVAVTATEMGVGITAFTTPSANERKPNATLTVSRFQK